MRKHLINFSPGHDFGHLKSWMFSTTSIAGVGAASVPSSQAA